MGNSSRAGGACQEDEQQRSYFASHGSPLLVDYLHAEVASGERIVVENEHWGCCALLGALALRNTGAAARRVTSLPALNDNNALGAILSVC